MESQFHPKVGSFPLPQLRYDGLMGAFYQFTEMDATAESYGCSFYLTQVEFSPARLQQRREEKRRQFQTAKL